MFPFGKSRCPFSAYELSCVKRRNEKEIKRRRNIRNATPRKAASVKSIPSSDFTFCLMHLIPGTRITEIPNIVLEKQFHIGDCWNNFFAMVLISCPWHGIFDALFKFFKILVDFESAHNAYPYIKSFISWVYLRFTLFINIHNSLPHRRYRIFFNLFSAYNIWFKVYIFVHDLYLMYFNV